MSHTSMPSPTETAPNLFAPFEPSRLMLSDRLLSLAEAAGRAGCAVTAEHLLALAHTVFDDLDISGPH